MMLAFYTVPIPGFGISFTHLILDQVQTWSRLSTRATSRGSRSLNDLESSLPPSPLAILEVLRFFILVICIVAAQAVTLYVVMYGYVATAVIMLLGPVFIPFKIVPHMEWMFLGMVPRLHSVCFLSGGRRGLCLRVRPVPDAGPRPGHCRYVDVPSSRFSFVPLVLTLLPSSSASSKSRP